MLLEVGPQPILTAAALRAWPDPATAPRAIASLRRKGADHRQITEALATTYTAGHLPDFAAVRPGSAHNVDLPTYPFQRKAYWFRDERIAPSATAHMGGGATTEAVRLLEDGRIDELATLLGGTDESTTAVLNKLAAQHNRQRTAQSVSDARYEIRWDKLTAAAPAEAGEGSAWVVIGDDAAVLAPLTEALTAEG